MNEIKVFDNDAFGSVRTIGREGDVWFVGKDVAAALGIATRMMRCLAMLTPKISIKGRGSRFPTPMERFNIQQLSTSLAYTVLFFQANFRQRNSLNDGLLKRLSQASEKQEGISQRLKPTLRLLGHWPTLRKKRNGCPLKTRK